MPVVSGQGTTYNLPNFVGELFGITPTETPLLSALGGMTGGARSESTSFTIQKYDIAAAAQPGTNLEGQNAPAASNTSRQQDENVVQIFHETIEVSYTKQAARGAITGVPILGNQPVQDELTFQTNAKLQKIARDVEYTFVQGAYQKPVDNTTARKSRGVLTAIATNAVAAAAAAFSKTLFEQLLQTMFTNGAQFGAGLSIMANGNQVNRIADVYGYAPQDRNVGGVQMKQILTNYGPLNIIMSRFIPNDTVSVVDLSVMAPVILEIPQKGFLFREELAKAGAATKYQIYGEIGLQHGPEIYHGKLTGLAP